MPNLHCHEAAAAEEFFCLQQYCRIVGRLHNDAQCSFASLADTYRQEFASVINNNGGSVSKLIEILKKNLPATLSDKATDRSAAFLFLCTRRRSPAFSATRPGRVSSLADRPCALSRSA